MISKVEQRGVKRERERERRRIKSAVNGGREIWRGERSAVCCFEGVRAADDASR